VTGYQAALPEEAVSCAAVERYPRDLAGYGPNPPHPRWPGGARIAVSVVVNWEEGGETNVLHGDATSEAASNDVVDARPRAGARDLRTESMFEYGSRAGVWRLRRLLAARGIPATIFAVGMAVERSPDVVAALAADGHEICPHGWTTPTSTPSPSGRTSPGRSRRSKR
jgi:peptidoglycan/xylan/chitin deacetylase (PgdA/CDA1 family)